jgi:ubiquinol-cytochrome c reductase cytochrome b subunit
MVMAIAGAILITGGVFPIDLGFKFEPTVPPGITVPEWYLTGLYAFLRTQYDKFVTGVLWPGLFIASLLLIPFIDRYKKFSWKDRPIITAFGITGISQIMVTTYWGFYIPSDTTIPLVQRLVIDPIFLYLTMILLVPLGFGFSYMMIHLAKEAERKAKLAKEQGPKKVAAIDLSDKWVNWVIVALIAFMVFLNIAAYNAAITGFKNLSLFWVGLILFVFAAFFHVYRYAMGKAKDIPKPPPAIVSERPKALSEPSQESETPQLPEGTSGSNDGKEIEKPIVAETPSNVQADLSIDSSKDQNIGSSDIPKP